MKRRTIFILLLVLSVHLITAQNTLKNSIPETVANAPTRLVRNIIQVRNGNIWIATHEGVFRYDGKSFTNITREVAPPRVGDGPENRFHAVMEDRDGKLWFGSTDSGVYSYDGKSFRHFTISDGLPCDRVRFIHQDKTGNIWFATLDGLSLYDGKTFQNFTTKDGLPSNDIMTIGEDKTGKLWFGTSAGVSRYDGVAFTTMMKNINGRSIIEDKKGNMWLSSVNGLWKYDGSNFINIISKNVSDVIQDRKGDLWICSDREEGFGWSVSRLDEETGFTKTTAIAESDKREVPILTVLADSEGNIWFGSHGVYRYNGKNCYPIRAMITLPNGAPFKFCIQSFTFFG